LSRREAAARMTTARPRQGRRERRVEILRNEESVGQRAGVRSLSSWLESNSGLFLRTSREARRNRSYELEVVATILCG
jgi:hypothetical protein